MFTSFLYTLSDGSKTKNFPYFFTDRETLINRAKEIEKKLKFSKKIKGDDFIDVWINNPDVKEYRQLLREIWGFTAKIYVTEIKQCCQKSECLNTEDLVKVAKYCKVIKYTFYDTFCSDCAKKEIEFWGMDGWYEITVTPHAVDQEEIFKQKAYLENNGKILIKIAS